MAIGKSNQPGSKEPGYDLVAWDSCPELMWLAARKTQALWLNDEREASNGSPMVRRQRPAQKSQATACV